MPLHNTKTEHFRGVKKWLVIIMIRGDPDEVFLSYGFDEERSKVLYSSFKHPLPIIFQDTASKKHAKMLIKEKQTQEISKLSFFLPSTTDRKEKINKFFGNVNLHPIDCPYDDFVNYSTKNHSLLLHHLDSRNTTEWEAARDIVRNFLKHVAEMSNSNLIRNANSLMAKNEAKIDTKVEFGWVSDVHPQNKTKFKQGY